jgi:hypothetical protein
MRVLKHWRVQQQVQRVLVLLAQQQLLVLLVLHWAWLLMHWRTQQQLQLVQQQREL